jgi:hypothetical protein
MSALDEVQTALEMDGRVITSPQYYYAKAQRVFEVVDRLRSKAQQMFDAANVLRKRQMDKSLPFEERYRATILIEEANELAKDHLDLVDRLISRGANSARTPRPA